MEKTAQVRKIEGPRLRAWEAALKLCHERAEERRQAAISLRREAESLLPPCCCQGASEALSEGDDS